MSQRIQQVTAVLLLSVFFTLNACKSKSKKTETDTTPATTESTTSTEPAKAADASGRYSVSFSPDSASLGKKNEFFIKLNEGESVELSDPDGKSTGSTLTIKFTVTNRNKIGEGSGLFLHIPDQRLLLDNGSQITSSNGTSDVTAQEASSAGSLEFTVPAGAKATKLNLFEDGTRSAIELKFTKK